MNFSFGLITDGTQKERLNQVLKSIIWECSGRCGYEIIVVGGDIDDIDFGVGEEIKHIEFDESIKPGHITKKKNLIAQCAIYNNICYLHDYVALESGWLDGFNKFGDNWLTCTNKIKNSDNTRFHDWCVLYDNSWMDPPIDNEQPPSGFTFGVGRLLSYDHPPIGRWQYYSGQYFLIKKSLILEIPLDESRIHGQGEDVQIAKLWYQKYGSSIFNFNPHSSVRFLKYKQPAPWESLSEIV